MSIDLSKLSQFAQGGELERKQTKPKATKAKPVSRSRCIMHKFPVEFNSEAQLHLKVVQHVVMQDGLALKFGENSL